MRIRRAVTRSAGYRELAFGGSAATADAAALTWIHELKEFTADTSLSRNAQEPSGCISFQFDGILLFKSYFNNLLPVFPPRKRKLFFCPSTEFYAKSFPKNDLIQGLDGMLFTG